jgi:aspartyl aminopeptidase
MVLINYHSTTTTTTTTITIIIASVEDSNNNNDDDKNIIIKMINEEILVLIKWSNLISLDLTLLYCSNGINCLKFQLLNFVFLEKKIYDVTRV